MGNKVYVKHIHTFGSSFTEGGGFEWWSYDNMLPTIYGPYVEKWPEEKTQFPFSWPGQLSNLIKEKFPKLKNIDFIHNHARCGWGNERTYRKIWEIVNKDGFKPEEHLFLIEFSDESRAEFWSVKKQKHFLVNYDYGEEDREGLLYKQDVEPVFDYHRETFIDENEYCKSIAPMMTNFIRETYERKEVHRRIEQNQVTFCSWMEMMGLNWLVPLPNVVCWHPKWWKFMSPRIIKDKYGGGYQYSITQMNLNFAKETAGFHTDWHGGLAWSKIVARLTFNKMVEHGYLPSKKLDASEKWQNSIKREIRNEIHSRKDEIQKVYNQHYRERWKTGLQENWDDPDNPLTDDDADKLKPII